MNQNINILLGEISMNKQHKAFQYFWIGLLIYSVGYAFSTTTLYDFKLLNLVQLIGIALLGYSSTGIFSFQIQNNIIKALFYMYLGWLLLIIIHGIKFDYEFIKRMLFEPWYGIFMYMAPLAFLFPKNSRSFSLIFYIITAFNIIFLASVLFYSGIILAGGENNLIGAGIVENFSMTFGIACGYILLTSKYQSRSRIIIALLTAIVILFLAIIRARRGLSFNISSMIVLAYLYYYIYNKGKLLNKFITILLIPILVLWGINFFNDNKTGMFNLITERITEDTRTGVEIMFFQDMNPDDWIMGKGIDGQYYCPGIDEGENNDFRKVIETGYLHIILKGGIISLVLFLLITIPAIILGLFYSKNHLIKASALWIFLALINLYPAQVHSFTVYYLVVWISISLCYSKKLRLMPESEIIEFFEFSRFKVNKSYITFQK